ncbi:phosphohistidine phosphatase [Gracilimonas mengyeensis]|uniref:Phosphohistidine phosphatase n=2 Tax=Gracilimonas mengyeensis TaxID=1302730 RepID=A0A521CBL2_9BACT|nr:phosphohistidine phosphatase [Gracilimonas mengyeensis]
MRHAKSSWENPGLEDFDRPLAQRGQDDAPVMGKFIRAAGYKPAIIISSTAERARQTAELVSESAQIGDKILWNSNLYYGGGEDYLDAIREADDDIERVMLVGHNPLMESTATRLCDGGARAAIRMPTAALVCLQSFADSWSAISQGSCQLKWMMIPKVARKLQKEW